MTIPDFNAHTETRTTNAFATILYVYLLSYHHTHLYFDAVCLRANLSTGSKSQTTLRSVMKKDIEAGTSTHQLRVIEEVEFLEEGPHAARVFRST